MVDCKQCQQRIENLNGRKVQDVYAVGNPAKDQMGHEMFFSSEGRTSLCSAKRIQQDGSN